MDDADLAKRCRAAWVRLGQASTNSLDYLQWRAAIDADLEKHGAPADWTSFIEHYNRLLEARPHHNHAWAVRCARSSSAARPGPEASARLALIGRRAANCSCRSTLRRRSSARAGR
jgi:hypothetical protein